ncbi:MAG TPA: ABATE domain-containing protein [Pseudonocardiaceae bacterium]|nr:ABATE domain-containing protein [Pseudonocardiaceae bacterium]
MTTPSAVDDRFRLIGGRPSLDLIATYGKRHTAHGVERLPDNETMLDWLIVAGILPSDAAAFPVRDGQLDAARLLREAVHRLVRATMAGESWDASDIALVNEVAAGPDLAPRLGSAPGRGSVGWGALDPVDAALATLARDAIDLLTGSRTARIKECEYPDCSLLFLDDSQSGRRRWCSMDRCGNLVKIAGYRRRTRN